MAVTVSTEVRTYRSSIPELGSMFMGYIKGVPIAFFGSGEAGKSILMFQEAVCVAAQMSKNILMLGTEGAEDVFVDLWLPTFRKRFNFIGHVDVVSVETVEDLLKRFGREIEIKISEKGKADIIVTGSCKNDIGERIIKDNIGVVMLDSFTMPFRTEFAGGRMNFAGRADAECLIFGELRRLSRTKNLVVLMSHHATMDPTNPYAKPAITGGKNILHNFKVALYVERSKSPNIEKMCMRRIYLARFFNRQAWKDKRKITLTDNGFIAVIDDGEDDKE